MSDDGDGLAAQVGQGLAGVEHGAKLLRLHRVFEWRVGIEGQQAVDGREVVFAHGAVVGRKAEDAIANAGAVVRRVDRFDDTDHFVAGLADGCGIMVLRQVMQMTHIAAAEGQAQRLDNGGARLQGR